jgi:hypothetical protein
MSCKGLKGDSYKQCMKRYSRASKKNFPKFNQEKDTVITTVGPNLAEIQKPHRKKIKNSGGTPVKTRQFYLPHQFPPRKFAESSLVKKKKK